MLRARHGAPAARVRPREPARVPLLRSHMVRDPMLRRRGAVIERNKIAGTGGRASRSIAA
ncbi:hypothetical protein Y5A_022235 [Burkholderia glumae AU6208]|nr:hypothetical protein Y5A_022235 [Burkholderia glumae AU6208]